MTPPRVPEFVEAGHGPRVILVHSSVAGARQWGRLMNDVSGQYHVIAPNLFGYGNTSPWTADAAQTLSDQAELLRPFLPDDGAPVSIVGHSFGGSVAMKAAALFGDQVRRLVLIEPNPFYLLKQHRRFDAFDDAARLQAVIKSNGARGSWDIAAKVFADYWTGAGSWDAMPDARQAKFAEALKPNFHEWDAVMGETTPLATWAHTLPRHTTVITANDTVRVIREICALMKQNCPDWRFETLVKGGHMAALYHPDAINPIIARALE